MTCSAIRSLMYWTPSSMVVLFCGEFTRSFLNVYVAHAVERSHLQRLKITASFPTPLSVTWFLAIDPSSWASLPSDCWLLALLSQHQSSKAANPLICLAAVIFLHLSRSWCSESPSYFHFLSEFSQSFFQYLCWRTRFLTKPFPFFLLSYKLIMWSCSSPCPPVSFSLPVQLL